MLKKRTEETKKQKKAGVFRKTYSENMQQIYMRTSIMKCDFNKVALVCIFTKITIRYGCSTVNLLHVFRTPFRKNTSVHLLLQKRKDLLCIKKSTVKRFRQCCSKISKILPKFSCIRWILSRLFFFSILFFVLAWIPPD